MATAVSSKVAAIVVLAPLLVVAWFAAPLVLPIWRWRHLDLPKLSADTHVPIRELAQEYDVLMRYHPRKVEGDPCPWQIISSDPTWLSVDDQHADEDHLLVRCTFISECDGKPPSKLFLGSGSYKDRYWRAKALRLPPGSYGFNKKRPVVVYRRGTLEKCDFTQSQVLEADCTGVGTEKYENDDDAVDDGVMP